MDATVAAARAVPAAANQCPSWTHHRVVGGSLELSAASDSTSSVVFLYPLV